MEIGEEAVSEAIRGGGGGGRVWGIEVDEEFAELGVPGGKEVGFVVVPKVGRREVEEVGVVEAGEAVEALKFAHVCVVLGNGIA